MLDATENKCKNVQNSAQNLGEKKLQKGVVGLTCKAKVNADEE